jgi:uncharacterized protein YdeI (YjbR/CyaY-like superfamily)
VLSDGVGGDEPEGVVGTPSRYLRLVELPELVVEDVQRWRAWLQDHHADSPGVRLVLAKKGTTDPTALSYDAALEEAICAGWIDGQLESRDASTFRRRFTPRKAKSRWSQRNVAIAERLISAGRMLPAGDEQVRRARDDGRWDAAYAGQATMGVPEDLTRALELTPPAQAMFLELTRANRYAILYRVGDAKSPGTRAKRIEQFVEMLARGETPTHRVCDSIPGSHLDGFATFWPTRGWVDVRTARR